MTVLEPGRPLFSLPGSLASLDEVCVRAHSQVIGFLTIDAPTERLRAVQDKTRTSLAVIASALDRYRPSELSLSYNGGKDCLVLLVLYLCALHSAKLNNATISVPDGSSPRAEPLQSLQCVYIQAKDPFPEVEAFVSQSAKELSLSLTRYAKPMRPAFTDYLDDFPSVKAIFVGTRRTDPHGAELAHFSPTDHGWPDFMRVHPVIDWHYAEIWAFIRHLRIPYCSLYDEGYTSLGGTTDTQPNPVLRRGSHAEHDGRTEFKPAYELVDDDEERLGRES